MIAVAIVNTKKFLPFFLLGLSTGFLVIFFSGLPFQWLLFSYISLTFLAFSALAPKKKYYFEFFLIITLTVGRPFLMYHPFRLHFAGAQNVPELFLYDVWLIALLFWWLASIFNINNRPKFNFQWIDGLALAFIFWSVISVINAKNYDFGFYEIIRLARQIILYFYISRNIRNPKDLNFIIGCLLLALLWQSFLATIQHLGMGMPFGLFQEVALEEETTGAARVGGTLYGASALSQFLELLVPLALALALGLTYRTRDKWIQIFCWFIFALGSIAIIFTYTRGAMISVALSIFLLFIIKIVISIKSRQGNKLFSLLAAFLLIITLIGIFYLFQDDILLRFTADDGGSADARKPMALVALDIIKQNPVFGIGLNNFNEVMGLYDMYVVLPNPAYAVHNVYLFFASEIGIPGLLFLVAVFVLIYKKGFYVLKYGNGFQKTIVSGLLIGIMSYLGIHANATLGFKYMVPIGSLLWIQFGIIVAVEKMVRNNQVKPKRMELKVDA